MIFYDTETCGLHGPVVLLQYAIDDGPIVLYEVWKEPVRDTMNLIEMMMSHEGGLCGFNLAFDHFHLCQLYTTLALLPSDEFPEDIIPLYAEMEPVARDGPALKPVTAFDIMLHARKGPYQSTMDRGDIKIKKIPTVLAMSLAQELEKRIPLKDIYFARRKNKFDPHFKVYPYVDADDKEDIDFKNIVLKFHASSALKALAMDALNLPPDLVLLFSDIDIDKKFLPNEAGFAPYAKAFWRNGNWFGAWPEVIKYHIDHWAYSDLARQYAEKDVEYTRDLYKFFGSPAPGDDDSILACMVGAVRWRGFSIDQSGVKELRKEAVRRSAKYPISPARAREYINEAVSDTERVVIQGSTKKTILEEIANYDPDPCEECDHTGQIWPKDSDNPIECPKCKGAMYVKSEASIRANNVLDARKAKKEIELYDKLLFADRFHASFVVIGTLSSRMAGTDSLNAQGIKKTKTVRSQFSLTWPGYILCGGDFSGFEVVLAEAVYNDPTLREDLLSGKKIHALFGQYVYPGKSYEDILATDGTEVDLYTRAKSAVFAMFYGGEGFTLKERLGVPIEDADAAYARFCRRYPGVGIARRKIVEMFQTLKQAGGIGSKITYSPAAECIESLFGFRRYFTLENQIVDALVALANDIPKPWKKINIKVVRREREQFVAGAVQSALFASAFGLQASNMRAAANHVIQSSGAQITKVVQRKIWDLQPSGVHQFHVLPMNVHDEIMCPTLPHLTDNVKTIVHDAVESFRPKVPLIKMEWKTGLNSWADKGK